MKRQILFAALFGILAPLSAASVHAASALVGESKVVSIRDDLTINLYMKNSPPVTVRLAGIVMPDEVCDQANCIPVDEAIVKVAELKPLLEKQLTGKTVRYEMNGRTNRMKYQATVYDGGNDIAIPLLRDGYAMWCPGVGAPAGKSTTTDYLRAEWEAISAKRGIWANGQSFAKPSQCKPVVTANVR